MRILEATIDVHTLITGLLGIICGIIGWFSRELWAAVQSLKNDLNELEVQMSRDFVRYDRLQDALKPIHESLALIIDKLDRKVDKD